MDAHRSSSSPSSLGRHARLGIKALSLVAVAVMAAVAITPSAPLAPRVSADNFTDCSSLGLTLVTRFSSPTDGTSTQSGVTITVGADNTTLVSWSSTEYIGAVIVKGGSAGPNGDGTYVKTYSPAAMSDPSANLTAPDNGGGQVPALSHVDFCAGTPPSTATLTLVKQLAGNPPSGDLATAWTLAASGPTSISGATGSSAVTGATVNVGTYSLSESGGPADAGNYSASAWSCVDTGTTTTVPVTDGQVTLVAEDDVTCTITNTYTPTPPSTQVHGNIQVTKVINSADGWTGGTFNFSLSCTTGSSATVTVTVAAGQSSGTSQAYQFLAGTACTVTELGPLTSAGDGYEWTSTIPAAHTVTIPANGTATVQVTNARGAVQGAVGTPAPTPTPSHGQKGETGTPAPTLPATSTLPGQGGGSNNSSLLLLLGAFGAASLVLISSTLLRERIVESIDR